ncbi:hypothetical protein [Methanobrevibacter arboriphilus]|nr:hypothetical protein [Methanobrevibacter arboriphilus]
MSKFSLISAIKSVLILEGIFLVIALAKKPKSGSLNSKPSKTTGFYT